jgi:hypothetical protein
MSVGMAVETNYLRSWVYRVTVADWYPLDLGSSQVYDVVWSPNDVEIAFLAAPEQGLDGLGLADALFNIYLMEPDGANLRPILKDIYQPRGLIWSRDGRWLLFNGMIRKANGIWAFNVSNSELVLVSKRQGRLSGWLPDGHRLLVWHQGEPEKYVTRPPSIPSIYDLEPLLEGTMP